ncbi:MAG: hypothetical protein AAF633_14895 [Chloroflexota bacterium]
MHEQHEQIENRFWPSGIDEVPAPFTSNFTEMPLRYMFWIAALTAAVGLPVAIVVWLLGVNFYGVDLLLIGLEDGDVITQVSQARALPTGLTTDSEMEVLPIWSPNGDYLAFTIFADVDPAQATDVALAPDRSVQQVILDANTGRGLKRIEGVEQIIFTSKEGWSPTDNYLALYETDKTDLMLTLFDTGSGSLINTVYPLDERFGMSWHPSEDLLFITTRNAENHPELRKIDAQQGDGPAFEPADGNASRADGVWSPDGERVAYIGWERGDDPARSSLLYGSLWVADADSLNATEHPFEFDVGAPVWGPEGSTLFLTSADQGVVRYDLGSETVDEIDGLTRSQADLASFSRAEGWVWSPSGTHALILTGDGVYEYQMADNTVAFQPFPNLLGVSWHPGGRGYLVNRASQPAVIKWLERGVVPPNPYLLPNGVKWAIFKP